jgi:hypothetical protein
VDSLPEFQHKNLVLTIRIERESKTTTTKMFEEIKRLSGTKAGIATLIIPPLIGYGVLAVATDYKNESKKPRGLPPIALEEDAFKTLELNTMLQCESSRVIIPMSLITAFNVTL